MPSRISIRFLLFLFVCQLGLSFEMAHQMEGEICDNSIDDDGDGLIDLNDPDCICPVLEPKSLIPNPSFEEKNCCPSGVSQLDCANTWIQASEATTDYYDVCGFVEREQFPVPLPIPDGNAYVGFRNGRYIVDEGNVNWKEYAGACLTDPLASGISYSFQFDIGFIKYQDSPPMNVVFYGSTSCEFLPFGVGDREYGCPTNGPEWNELGRVYVSGRNSWKRFVMTVTPGQDIYAMAIGPDCFPVYSQSPTYYYLDNLVLASTQSFEEIVTAKGHPCSPEYSLHFPLIENRNYQWYKDGIAIQGAQSPELIVGDNTGTYQVLLTGESFCKVSNEFIVKPLPTLQGYEKVVICEGDAFYFADQWLTQPGSYSTVMKTAFHCDSMVVIDLEVQPSTPDTISMDLFQGEKVELGHYQLRPGTEKLLYFRSQAGCDSMIYAIVNPYELYAPNVFSPNGDGRNDLFTLSGNVELLSVDWIQVFDRWGNILYDNSMENDQGWDGRTNSGVAPIGVYIYMVDVTLHDGSKKKLAGEFSLLR